MNSWVFQGNPNRFDVDQYLRSRSNIYWTVSQKKHREQVALGDLVFLWRARGRTNLTPGIVALGRITETCKPKSEITHQERLSDELWYDPGLEPDEVKAGIAVEEVRLTPEEGMLSLYHVTLDPLLAKMHIVTVRTGTNFPLSSQQASRLRILWESATREPEEQAYGGRAYTAKEGRLLYELHRTRERDQRLVQEAKQAFQAQHGDLHCEICGFSFAQVYGDIGEGFIEAHHKKPLNQLEPGEETQTSDLVMLCSNCHRMIHRADAPGSLEEFDSLYKSLNL